MGRLETVLAGRDGRYRLQRHMLDRWTVVVQTALNVPGFPKRVEGDRFLVENVTLSIEKTLGDMGSSPGMVVFMDNGAGFASMIPVSGAEEAEVKRLGVAWETFMDWGRVLDIDVITLSGAVSRDRLGMPSRRCMVCGGDAKTCARRGRHPVGILRDMTEKMTGMGVRFLSDR